jgi:hypothetical protein
MARASEGWLLKWMKESRSESLHESLHEKMKNAKARQDNKSLKLTPKVRPWFAWGLVAVVAPRW